MIVSIQQPEHLPWIGFFNKMVQSDKFVFLDNVQFKKRYFENRNKINTKDGVKWLTVPVLNKGKYSQKINETLIDNNSSWKKKYLGLLESSYKKYPYFEDIKKIVFTPITNDFEKLIDLNSALINNAVDYLCITNSVINASEIDLEPCSGSDLILEICKKLKATTYISGPDGRNYLNLDSFNENGIDIAYHDYEHPVYSQLNGDFVSHMSIVDLIANQGKESLNIVKGFSLGVS